MCYCCFVNMPHIGQRPRFTYRTLDCNRKKWSISAMIHVTTNNSPFTDRLQTCRKYYLCPLNNKTSQSRHTLSNDTKCPQCGSSQSDSRITLKLGHVILKTQLAHPQAILNKLMCTMVYCYNCVPCMYTDY